MNKTCLFSLRVILCLLLFNACYEEIDAPPADPAENLLEVPFSMKDAQAYFAENATDLAPLTFHGVAARTRSITDALPLEITPLWRDAMVSGHGGVSLIEVPLRSNSVVRARRKYFEDGETQDFEYCPQASDHCQTEYRADGNVCGDHCLRKKRTNR